MATRVVNMKSIGEVTFYKNRRSKKIRISVKPDKSVLVSYPGYIPEKQVLSFLAESEDWIHRQQRRIIRKQTLYEDGSILNTKLHRIFFSKGELDNIEVEGNIVNVTLRDFSNEKNGDFIDRLLVRIYRNEARQILPGRLMKLAAYHGFSYNKVSVRNNKSNWGSCSSRNNISLNIQMIKLPDELIDYILLHELVHTEIRNHSPRFWQKLDSITEGNAKKLAGEVKKYSTYTF